MNKIALFVCAAVATGCSGAQAADLAAAPYTKAPVAVPTESWAGIYLGGQVGIDFTTARYDLTNAGQPESYIPNMKSALGGGRLGAQGQWGAWVLGVEGNYNWTSLKETDPSAIVVNRTATMSVDGIASVVGKVGYAFNTWMIYGKAGWADAKIDTSVTVPTASVNKWQSGWTVGGGLDYKITHNLIIGSEFDYYAFNFNRSGVGSDGSTVTWSASASPIYAVMFHLDYLFNTGSPVVAKY